MEFGDAGDVGGIYKRASGQACRISDWRCCFGGLGNAQQS